MSADAFHNFWLPFWEENKKSSFCLFLWNHPFPEAFTGFQIAACECDSKISNCFKKGKQKLNIFFLFNMAALKILNHLLI